jgi:hypothetical protein
VASAAMAGAGATSAAGTKHAAGKNRWRMVNSEWLQNCLLFTADHVRSRLQLLINLLFIIYVHKGER